jgi:hypothetical protein
VHDGAGRPGRAARCRAWSSHLINRTTSACACAGRPADWRYESTEALAFIQYREDQAVLSPVVREHSTTDSGTFEARLAQDCA